MNYILSFVLNGSPVEVLVKPSDTLLDVLREKLRVTSPKRGCDSGECGTCTVSVEDKPIRSCLTIAMTVAGKHVRTIESLTSKEGELHPLQHSFHKHGAAQCGFCTPGMLMSSIALLERNPTPTREEIVESIAGNLCRCGSYSEVIEAVEALVNRGQKE